MRNKCIHLVASITVLILNLIGFNAFSQVGIGTLNPNENALLELDATARPGGLLLPRLALTATNSPAPLVDPVPAGMTVYNTATMGTAPNEVTPGLYYHNGTNWVRMDAANGDGPDDKWKLTGNAGTTPGTHFIGTTDNVSFQVKTNNAARFDFTNNGRLRSYDDGLASQPTYSWNGANGQNMGMFRAGSNGIGFSTASNERMRILANGRVYINTTNPPATDAGQFTVQSANLTAISGLATGSGSGVYGVNQTANGIGVQGVANSANARGGYFSNTHTSGFGLWSLGGGNTSYFFNNSGTGAAITGRLFGTTSFSSVDNGIGIAGVGDNLGSLPPQPSGVGVLGFGFEAGVYGDSGYYGMDGVHGNAEGNPSGTSYGTGVYGSNVGGLGDGVFGQSTNVGVRGYGVHGAILESNHVSGYGVIAWNTDSGVGLSAIGQNSDLLAFAGTGAILVGRDTGGSGWARSVNGTGLIGMGNNITVASLAPNGSGMAGTGLRAGVYGKANQVSNGVGVIGAGNNLSTYLVPNPGAGVAGTGVDIGVYGHATNPSGFGVYSSGNMFVDGTITLTDPIIAPRGIFSEGVSISDGNVVIDGTFSTQTVLASGDLTAGGVKNFIIDDPRDPANKFLKHASIESNEILNLYRGVDTFDASGQVVVQLPDYYDAINKNASYQLTPIGASMPNLYIAEEVNSGFFVIAGGVPSKKVSWTITAERNDAYIRNNPEARNMVVDKGADRGFYITPEAYGHPANSGILRSRMSKMRNSSVDVNANQLLVAQKMESKTVEAKKVKREEIEKITSPFEGRRASQMGGKEKRDMPLLIAEEVKNIPSTVGEEQTLEVSSQTTGAEPTQLESNTFSPKQ